MEPREKAKRMLRHYLKNLVITGGGRWESDNDSEVGDIVDFIVDAAVEAAKEVAKEVAKP